MKIAYFDCFAGAGGDMIVASLLDAGADFQTLSAALAGLGVEGFTLRTEKVRRGGLAGLRFIVEPTGHQHEHHHRGLSDILAILDRSNLPPRAGQRARAVFARLAQAEAKVHGVPVDQVHFHEVGAVDSICDVVGACVALELLGIDEVYCSAIPIGSGTVQTAHGLLPVPAPATAELLAGAMISGQDMKGEVVTPTAAAVLTALGKSFGPPPAMAVSAVGWGAGTIDAGPIPNLLRVLVGSADDSGQVDSAVELAANIDDCSGELLGATIDMLISAGCLDAWASPIYMKKNRPAYMLCALCLPHDVQAAERIIFSQTTTFGIRRRACVRSKLSRTWKTVQTPYGQIRIKVGAAGEYEMTAAPEFSDCLSAAQAHGVAVKEVFAAAMQAYLQLRGPA
ncbi:MAG: nickel pincer cofactor biosynthesis protein LarC [Planctomycetes bacterium]|nr:nickel pincer cofactor biosynthesis protein LarC [Planctomycetota bacterium]